MAVAPEPSKAKIAKRVIEVLECFGEDNQNVTVMDIVNRYGRPQSSTSELLAALVEMGLLYKDARSRSYFPTPRLAGLGISAQPEIIRNGHLFSFMDRLARTTGYSAALFGMNKTHSQIFHLVPGPTSVFHDISYGACEQLTGSVAGLLLLSTLPLEQANGLLWRLNAEAFPEDKFDFAKTREYVSVLRRQGYVMGNVGFGSSLQMAATLLPAKMTKRPLVLGLMYPADAKVNATALMATLKRDLTQYVARMKTDYPERATAPLRMVV